MNQKTSFLKKPAVQTVMASLICAILGLLVGFIVLLCIDAEHAGQEFVVLLRGFFRYDGKMLAKYFGSTLVYAVPLILCAQAILFAYKAGLFNIGAAGQYTAGMIVSLVFALKLQLPWYVCLPASMLAGALFGAVCGILKALLNVNEVISGIMLNWISLYLANTLLVDPAIMNSSTSRTYELMEAAPQALLPNLGMGALFGGNKYVTIAIPLTILVAVALFVILNKTTFGFELKATGYNKDAARYAGMNANRNIVVTLVISGAIAGLAAACYYLTGIEQYSKMSSVPAMGFNGIAVAFLGSLNPFGALIAGYFVEYISYSGGTYLNHQYFSAEVADLIIAVIIFLCGFVLFIKQLLGRAGKKKAEEILREHDANASLEEPATKKGEV